MSPYVARVSTTPAERKALLFLAALLLLGAAMRMVSARSRDTARLAMNPRGLAQQIAAVDSERVRVYERRRSARARKGPSAGRNSRESRPRTEAADTAIIVDVDHANTAELERLPRIGPALAQRIVKDRDEHGPFGSLEGLTRVKGIGPKLVMQLAAHVTFSGSARPPTALSVSPGAVPRVGRSPPPG
ncbi:MAG: helix-hairpin-helix domain-containing protein [Gemmatimonadota bacterium]